MTNALMYSPGQTATFTAQSPGKRKLMKIKVLNSRGSAVLSPARMKPLAGFSGLYFYDWRIPSKTHLGSYVVVVSGGKKAARAKLRLK